ncbi:MAG: glycosyltransferase family 39 protein [Verrucomicrobia bacterium]|nr:glycosyltransferase family 39 protein [Verrucomicrobiota bacterium]
MPTSSWGSGSRGNYRYDPDEYHGPSLYYLSLPFAWASGARTAAALSETTLRLVPAVFGLGLILLLPLLRDGLGGAGTVWAAVFTAVSTAFVYYSRYFIHEVPLIFFAALLGAALWRYWQKPSWGWAALGAGAGVDARDEGDVRFSPGSAGRGGRREPVVRAGPAGGMG